ncbi:helix-turn-helix domain-containing protein [Fibrobacter sp. UWB7]|uniref:AlbA family DNA-binding domain-containing protein n=1 Tax=Fibrobacter sp. UWB7 TaxID=1896206 RepID=UPI0009209CDC|nr:helix-turn-helix domain-containing protein [Fibrobacter sp. UWB7]SHM73201.1 Predicted transcriptional regulator, contains HTH domain [Fibrobacter sp. UWB7]
MTADEIKRGESEVLEFKGNELSEDPKKWLKTAIAFANGKGGSIVFGVEDVTLKITGVPSVNVFKFMDSITNEISDSCSPQIFPHLHLETIEDKTIVVMEIFKGDRPPYFFKPEGERHGVYIRVGATTRKAEPEKIREMMLYSAHKSYDEIVERGVKPATKKQINELRRVIAERSTSHKKVSVENLVSWGLLKEQDGSLLPSIAFRLLAANDLYFAKIQCARFKGLTRSVFLDRKEFDGPIYQQIEDAFEFIYRHTNVGAQIKGLYRKDVYDYPPEAVRELLANAVMHRNYMDSSCIQISVFDDRIEFQNPGGIFGDLSLEKVLAGYSSVRNTQIADIFQKMNIVEKWGTGLLRIADICKEAGSSPVQYQAGSGYFMATLLRKGNATSRNDTINFSNDTINTENDTINDTINEENDTINELSDKERQIFDSIKQENSITAQKIATQLNISIITVKRAINTLKTKGLIVRVGSNKTGFWSVKEK